jgi:hypothetical protein
MRPRSATDEANGSIPQLSWVLPWCWHDSILSKEWSLQETQGGSVRAHRRRVDEDLVGIDDLGEVCRGAPGCFPWRRPAAFRCERARRFGFPRLSFDGSIEELRGLRPMRCSRSARRPVSSTILAHNRTISSACVATSSNSAAFSAASASNAA